MPNTIRRNDEEPYTVLEWVCIPNSCGGFLKNAIR